MKHGKKITIIAVVAVVLTLFASVGVTLAFFSDYETALGEVKVHLNGQTTIQEEVTDTEKVISIFNDSTDPGANVVVRVIAYGPDGMTVTPADGHWIKNGDYYYYDQVLKPGEHTSNLTASVKDIPVSENMPAFDIVVNHESAIATYDENNNVQKPDGWNFIPTIKAAD